MQTQGKLIKCPICARKVIRSNKPRCSMCQDEVLRAAMDCDVVFDARCGLGKKERIFRACKIIEQAIARINAR